MSVLSEPLLALILIRFLFWALRYFSSNLIIYWSIREGTRASLFDSHFLSRHHFPLPNILSQILDLSFSQFFDNYVFFPLSKPAFVDIQSWFEHKVFVLINANTGTRSWELSRVSVFSLTFLRYLGNHCHRRSTGNVPHFTYDTVYLLAKRLYLAERDLHS